MSDGQTTASTAIAAVPPLYPLWLDFAVLAVWLAGLTIVSLRVYRWE